MWIKKINQKLTRSAYVMHGQFREDMHQIMKNAVTYNTSTADCAHPGPLFVIVLPLVFALFWHCFCTVLALFLRCFATLAQQECHQPNALVSQHNCSIYNSTAVCKHRSEVKVCLKAVVLLICRDKLLNMCCEIFYLGVRAALSLTVLLQMRLAWPTRFTRLPLLDWTNFQQRSLRQSNRFSKRRLPLLCN